jgi:hypothetical protein
MHATAALNLVLSESEYQFCMHLDAVSPVTCPVNLPKANRRTLLRVYVELCRAVGSVAVVVAAPLTVTPISGSLLHRREKCVMLAYCEGLTINFLTRIEVPLSR